MTAPLRIALLGAGLSGAVLHAPALKRIPEADLVAVADPDPRALRAIRPLAPAAQCFEDPMACIRQPGLNACIVATPNAWHADQACEALDRGLHVYVEKPLAADLASADRVMRAWANSDRIAQVGFNYRWSDLHRQGRAGIREGRIGRLLAAQGVFCSATHAVADWRKRRGSGGGVLLDRLSHHLDLLEWYLGAPLRWIECELASRRSEHDTALFQAGFGDGFTAQSFASFDGVEVDRLTFFGDSGAVEIDRYAADAPRWIAPTADRLPSRRWLRATRELLSASRLKRKLNRAPDEASYEHALREFVNAVRENRPASPDLNVGLRSLIVLDAAERAASERRRVEVPR